MTAAIVEKPSAGRKGARVFKHLQYSPGKVWVHHGNTGFRGKKIHVNPAGAGTDDTWQVRSKEFIDIPATVFVEGEMESHAAAGQVKGYIPPKKIGHDAHPFFHA